MDIDLWSPRLVAGFSAGEDSEFSPSRDAMLARLCRAKRLGAGILATPTGHASHNDNLHLSVPPFPDIR